MEMSTILKWNGNIKLWNSMEIGEQFCELFTWAYLYHEDQNKGKGL
jgi:hypothetical protein